MRSLVTIGIPTFNRPELLQRSLTAVAAQDYSNIEVIVADNASPDLAAEAVTAQFAGRIPRLVFVRHPESVGAIGNFLNLLSRASGEYFMWLADDDEISSNYVSSLVDLLDAHPDAATAAGHWVQVSLEGAQRPMPTASFPEHSALRRALRFVAGTDDSFFYGIHRTAVLRQASFPGYWKPNEGVPKNWAFVFLMDVVLRGRVLLAEDRSVQFLNHVYTEKEYPEYRGSRKLTSFVIRRVNVYSLYIRKCANVLGPLSIPLILGASVIAFLKEPLELVRRRSARLP